VPRLRPLSDGVVVIRPPTEDDVPLLVAARDAEFHRFLGPGAERPWPTACITVDGDVVGWVDFDPEPAWLEEGEVNVGYFLAAPHRGKGYGTRAVELLLRHLAEDTSYRRAVLRIDRDNARSLALAARAGFTLWGPVDGSECFKRAVRLTPRG
jgi:RimJ/RimL family protein N-acetyltransferase